MTQRRGLVREAAHFDRPVTPLFSTTVLPAMAAAHRAASAAQGGGAGVLHLETVDGWVYAAWSPSPAPTPLPEDAPDVFALVDAWERQHVPEVRERLVRLRGLARPGLPARRMAAELDAAQALLEESLWVHDEVGFATLGAVAMMEGILAARGDPAPALRVATLLAPCPSLLQEVDVWIAKAGAAPDPLRAARESPLWDLVRDRPVRLDLDAPTWGEDPAPLERALRLARLDAHEAGLARALAAQAAAEADVLARFPPDAYASVRAVIDALRRARAAQQTLNLLAGELAIGLTRQAWLRAGQALATAGLLPWAGDVVWLTRDEAWGALLGEPLARGVVDARRKAHARAMAAAPPDVLGEVDSALLADPRIAALLGHRAEVSGTHGTEEAALRGLGASPGRARGRARVAATEEEVEALQPGEILVVASLLPTWTPAMQRAAGIVTETGGILSHGAVVAREMGVPAVVGVPGATRRIRSGDEIGVDGASGEVAAGKGIAFST